MFVSKRYAKPDYDFDFFTNKENPTPICKRLSSEFKNLRKRKYLSGLRISARPVE